MIGRRFGKLVVLDKTRKHPTAKKDNYYKCQCDCGIVCEARGSSMKKGHKTSCGCAFEVNHTSPWVGKKVGQLLVLEKLVGEEKYRCLCDCGREIISTNMWSRAKAANAHCRGPAHNKPPVDKPHKSPRPRQRDHWAYGIWAAMKQRCFNPRCVEYHRYGGRGISVCKEWVESFWAYATFVDSLPGRQQGYSLDRRDNDGNYEPGNMRWASAKEQVDNRRISKRPAHLLCP